MKERKWTLWGNRDACVCLQLENTSHEREARAVNVYVRRVNPPVSWKSAPSLRSGRSVLWRWGLNLTSIGYTWLSWFKDVLTGTDYVAEQKRVRAGFILEPQMLLSHFEFFFSTASCTCNPTGSSCKVGEWRRFQKALPPAGFSVSEERWKSFQKSTVKFLFISFFFLMDVCIYFFPAKFGGSCGDPTNRGRPPEITTVHLGPGL